MLNFKFSQFSSLAYMKGKKQALQYNFPSYICIIPRMPILPIRIPIPTASYFDWLLHTLFCLFSLLPEKR